MTLPDPVSSLVQKLQGDASIQALTTLVFGGELPRADPPAMPEAAIVVVPAGGSSNLGGGYLPFNDFRVDVICYGATLNYSYLLWDAVVPVLTKMTKTGRTYWARLAGGPMSLRDPTTDWPMTRGSFQILANEP